MSKAARLARLVRRTRALRPKGVLLARWHPFLGLVSRHWRRKGGAVVLLVQGNDESLYETYPWFRRVPFAESLVKRSLREADEVLVLNTGLKAWVDEVRLGVPGESVLFPTGVAAEFFEAKAESSAAYGRYVLFFGNLATWQGIDYLLAAKSSSSWPADIHLVVVGDGDAAAEVNAAADRDATLHYLGKLQTSELAPLVAGALATACTKKATGSMAETTTPFKMLESVAAGVPVIATDIPAQRRLVDPGAYGMLVSPDDPLEFTRAVAQLSVDSALRDRLVRGAIESREGLSWESAAPKLGETLERAARRVTKRVSA